MPESLHLDYSGSIAIPAVKHALLITLRTKKCRNKYVNKYMNVKINKYIKIKKINVQKNT